ncbi:MAG: FHA domain-containing protein [Planctomycetes bacterium]|nr:FHA domain-containing protein [Planctomycetota bacterium]MBM4079282.1 FHA domain-containing protein [Planctomycetota bacterium]MBM4083282.1 FHA domain-containing protein [Planctomycetota bacterium]
MTAHLVGLKGDAVGVSVEFQDTERPFLGRMPANKIVVPDVRVSRVHCQFVCEKDEWHLVHLGGTNPTFVNGESKVECALKPGDVVQVGQSAFRFGHGPLPGAATSPEAVTQANVTAYVLGLAGAAEGIRCGLQEGDKVFLGRLPDNGIPVKDPKVSPVQCQFVSSEGKWRLVHLGGDNPTLVNGKSVLQCLLNSECVIEVGTSQLRFGLGPLPAEAGGPQPKPTTPKGDVYDDQVSAETAAATGDGAALAQTVKIELDGLQRLVEMAAKQKKAEEPPKKPVQAPAGVSAQGKAEVQALLSALDQIQTGSDAPPKKTPPPKPSPTAGPAQPAAPAQAGASQQPAAPAKTGLSAARESEELEPWQLAQQQLEESETSSSFGKIFLIVVVIAALAGGGYYAHANKLLPWQTKKKPAASSTEKPAATDKAEESKEQK